MVDHYEGIHRIYIKGLYLHSICAAVVFAYVFVVGGKSTAVAVFGAQIDIPDITFAIVFSQIKSEGLVDLWSSIVPEVFVTYSLCVSSLGLGSSSEFPTFPLGSAVP